VRRVCAAWLALAIGARALAVPWDFELPPGFPLPVVPPDNPMTTERVALGQRLFEDPRLSATGAYSCASCHDPARAFTDGRPVAIGATGERHERNTPSLLNVAYNASYGWTDQGLTTLERQHLVPLTSHAPLEMGFGTAQLAALAGDPTFVATFRKAFDDEPLGPDTVVKALAAYVRTLIRADSAYDRYLMWDERDALTADARTGMGLFFSERFACSGCHASFNLSGPVRHAGFPERADTAVDAAPVFHVNQVGGSSLGYRAPALRAVARTAPYMHDGSLETLDEVLSFYAAGGAERLPGFDLTDRERTALIAFLHAL
jgi:cytochrome c peroxidase